MPTGILRFFNSALHLGQELIAKPSSVLSCVKLQILRLREVSLHVFCYLSMANCNNCDTANVASNRFFTLFGIPYLAKVPTYAFTRK